MNSSSLPSLLCQACGGENASDSRFCRHCGAVMEKSTPIVADGASPSNTAPASPTPSVAPLAPASFNSDGEEMSSPAEIDARRARQLLERALFLSERNDSAGAILAARQSIALAPTAAGGHSMLGLLLERSGDITHAVTAYEKAVQLAPNSTLERESLERLREKLQGQKGAMIFHFDEEELYADTTPVAPPEKNNRKKGNPPAADPPTAPTELDGVAPVVAAAAITAAAVTPADAEEAPHFNIGAAAPGLPAAYTVPEMAVSEVATPHVSEFHGLDVKSGNSAPTVSGLDAKLPPSRPSATSQADAATPPAAPAPEQERRNSDRRTVAMPVPKNKRQNPDRRSNSVAPAPAAPLGMGPVAVAPIFIPGATGPDRANGWRNLWARPSFYGRSLPLVGATVLALGFLSLARSWAVAREPAPVVMVAPGTTEPVPAAPQDVSAPAPNPDNGAAPPSPAAANSAPAQTDGFPISNRPIGSAPAPAAAAAPATAPAAAAPAPATAAAAPAPRPATAGANGAAPRRVASAPRPAPRFPNVIPPAPIPSSGNNAGRNNGGSNDGGNLGLPAPNISAPAPAPAPVTVIPSDNTPPLNPAGASGRGYVRITQGRLGSSSAPTRSSSQANADERGAASASRTGDTGRAIERLSSAINADANDAGYRFQQRASLFLDRGDYSRAADDFQSAISAYNEQINRGEQVAAARAGLRASRSGLNLALAGGRR